MCEDEVGGAYEPISGTVADNERRIAANMKEIQCNLCRTQAIKDSMPTVRVEETLRNVGRTLGRVFRGRGRG